MKKSKLMKLTAFILCAIMLVPALPFTAHAADDEVHLYRRDRDFGNLTFAQAIAEIGNSAKEDYVIELRQDITIDYNDYFARRQSTVHNAGGNLDWSEDTGYEIDFPDAPVTIDGKGYTLQISGQIMAHAPITFTDVTISGDKASIYMNGYALTVEEDVYTINNNTYTFEYVYGGSKANAVVSADITLKAGTYYRVTGGSPNDSVSGTEAIRMYIGECDVRDFIYGSIKQLTSKGVSEITYARSLDRKVNKESFTSINGIDFKPEATSVDLAQTTFTGKELLEYRATGQDMVITNVNKKINLTAAALSSLTLTNSSKVVIIFDSTENRQQFNDKFVFRIEIDGKQIELTDQQIAVSVNIGSLRPTAEQIKNFTGVIYDDDGTSRQLGGLFAVDGVTLIFHIPGTGVYGTAVATELTKMKLTIGSTVYILNNEAKLNDVAPIITNSRTMLPFRVIAEALGATVFWDGTTQTVTLTKGATVVSFTLGKPLPNNLGTPVLIDERTYVPVRYIAEALGAHVVWNDEEKSVYIFQ